MRTVKCKKEYIRKKVPRKYSLNLQHTLMDREAGFNRRNWRSKTPTWHYTHEHRFYRSIRPNLTISHVSRPTDCLRAFTPDGKYLLGFSNDQRSIVLHAFEGVAKAYTLIQKIHYEHMSATDIRFQNLRRNIFSRLFTFYAKIQVVVHSTREPLFRDLCIFMNNGRYVLVGGSTPSDEELAPTFAMEYPDSNHNFEFKMHFYLAKHHSKYCRKSS